MQAALSAAHGQLAALAEDARDAGVAAAAPIARALESIASRPPNDPYRAFAAVDAAAEALREALDLASTERARDELTASIARALAVLHPLAKSLAPEPEEESGAITVDRGRGDESSQVLVLRAARRQKRASAAGAPPSERRRAPRVDLEMDLGLESASSFYAGRSGDVSDGGLFVATDDLLAIGTELTVSFVLPGGHQVVARACVRWRRETASARGAAGMGLSLEDLSDADRDAIHAFVKAREPLAHDDGD